MAYAEVKDALCESFSVKRDDTFVPFAKPLLERAMRQILASGPSHLNHLQAWRAAQERGKVRLFPLALLLIRPSFSKLQRLVISLSLQHLRTL